MRFVILLVLVSLITVWIIYGHEVDKKRWCLIFGHRPGPNGDCVRCKTYSELSFEEPLRCELQKPLFTNGLSQDSTKC
jgi:hypothetical protein